MTSHSPLATGTRTQLVLAFLAPLALVCSAYACGGATPIPQAPAPEPEVADAGPDVEPTPPPKTLYEKLGKEKIAGIVDSFMKTAASHPDLKKSFGKFTGKKADAFREAFANLLCKGAEGPCVYEGGLVESELKALKLSEKQWNAVVEVFSAACDERGASDEEKGDLLALIAPLKDKVVPAKK